MGAAASTTSVYCESCKEVNVYKLKPKTAAGKCEGCWTGTTNTLGALFTNLKEAFFNACLQIEEDTERKCTKLSPT